MEPTFSHGDKLFVLTHFPKRWLRRGNIVVANLNSKTIKTPNITIEIKTDLIASSEFIIKRIIGLHGDFIVGPVYETDTQGNPGTKFKLLGSSDKIALAEDTAPKQKIERGFFFLQGDNTLWSGDSRSFGLVPKTEIKGVVLARFLETMSNQDSNDS